MIKLSNLCILTLLFFTISFFSYLGEADLPIHALIKDVKGDWTIYLSEQKDGATSLCGSSMPNRNTVNLSPELADYKSFIERKLGGVKDKLKITLSDSPYPFKINKESSSKPHRAKWQSLAAIESDSKSTVGYWTPIYDEGFELRVGKSKYTAFYKYNKKDSCGSHDGDSVPPTGVSECYSTDPSATHIGWYYKKDDGENNFKTGCFYAEKSKDPTTLQSNFIKINDNGHQELSYIMSKEFIDKHNSLADRNWNAREYAHFKDLAPEDILNRFSPQRRIWRFDDNPSTPYFSFAEIEQMSSSSPVTKHACSCEKEGPKVHGLSKIETQLLEISQHKVTPTIPNEFSWGDPYLRPDLLKNFNVPDVSDQGSCGSCYAMASTYVLQHRFEIESRKQNEKESSFFELENSNLSPQSVLSCSFYNQGCNGGYPFLVAKHAYEIGIPANECMGYQASHNQECKIKENDKTLSLLESGEGEQQSVCMSNQRWYAKDYGYVGGCFECNGCEGEKLMMEEIYNSGPLVAALDAPPSLLSYSEGVYDEVKPNHGRVCDDPVGCNSRLSGWEYTNHAVAIVGWGEQKLSNGETQKYWVVRNTWGKNWGRDGYFKIVRGKNLAGIENQTVYIDPDFSRGKGLEMVKGA